MTGLEFLKQQVHPLQHYNISILTYHDEDIMRCPYCGKKIKTSFINKNVFTMSRCDCEGSLKEEKIVKKLNEISEQIKSLEKEHNNLKNLLHDEVYDSGVKLAAQHYENMKEKRDSFDEEIKRIAIEE